MDALGVQRPSAVLRVTEHVDAIVGYVRRIVENRYAYARAAADMHFPDVGRSCGHVRRYATPSGVCVRAPRPPAVAAPPRARAHAAAVQVL